MVNHKLLGFGYSHHGWRTGYYNAVYIPYWVLILVLGLGLFSVWRKTRPKPVGRAFPVDLSKPIGEHGGKAE